MSNLQLIIEERAADIGNFMVGRLLPFRQKRMVGPFIFIDHMGPAHLKANENIDIDMHPHIGLSTLTFLFEGNVFHRDSLGTAREIKSGEVNWMTAGKGVVHTERTPDYLRDKAKTLHGLQIWVALPKEEEECEPSFTHVNAEDLPMWEENGVHFKLIAGEAFGKKSPVPVYSPLYFVEIKSSETKTINIGAHLYGESALYILEGTIKSDGHTYDPKQILVAKDSSLCEFQIEANSTVYLFGGEAFPEERFIEWNFVATDKGLIEKAKQNWTQGKFPMVPSETVRVPLPSPRLK
ncbi:redox-sensitive bicupin YhaK (pirin superfamily) [Flavobacterium arsenatis]|uniref:Redox-sensitive bicupin YhaK (Pirin superfamily) n=1 Tax=Flavobacterium arsenatis TaxID=1484332 RepID=A0ABU1TQB3_9FLAO|nr:pirin family protein [Flavobacterium arsenatis]MDR6968096.1 redox-sensitive bicupin YhaK (pirin superfamily) [Flavobacterium arsenatis]